VPPQLPDRYDFEVRLGRDGDVEEWLATDTALDRPVLIRIVGPETTRERRVEFLEAVRGASGVTHTHVASIFAADALPDGAYSVSEWSSGLTLGHRREAGGTMPVHEFLPNAAGLAEALAALHERGVLHGAISEDSVFFSMAHPAKLAGFGGHTEGASARKDVRDLADVLVLAVTGRSAHDIAPSQMIDGLSPSIDRVLRRAQTGDLDAAGLAELLRAAPSASMTESGPDRSWSWRRILPAAGLLGVAIILFIIGRTLDTGSQDPLLFPVAPDPTVEESTSTTSSSTTLPGLQPSTVAIGNVLVFDPEGDGTEHDRSVPNLTDGDSTTSWSTERYNDPLPLIKSGVGFAMSVDGTPTEIELLGSVDGMSYRLLWAPSPFSTVAEWESIASGSIGGERGAVQLPSRSNGWWLVWITDVPADPDGGYVGRVGEVRFRP